MPKPTGTTHKGKLTFWLKQNPGMYRTKTLALEHRVSRAIALAALKELEANGMVIRRLSGRNTRWVVLPSINARHE